MSKKIAIMGAMEEEIEPLLSYFDTVKQTHYADNIYYECQYKNHEVVVAYSKIGKVFASLTATTMIQKFSCEILLFTGVAGAINQSLKIGDLIAPHKLCQHDLDITAFGHPHGFVPGGAVFVEADTHLLSLAQSVAHENKKELHGGIVATGDQFVHDNSAKDFIAKTFHADALEMEGASVAVVCKSLGIPFFVLRAISDSADMEASFDFDEFLKSSAKDSASFMIQLVDKIIPS